METEEQFHKKKSLGQHFLKNDVIPRFMCDAADLHPDDVVCEIGPGTGALTEELLRRGARVLALEADRRAITVLEERFKHECATGYLKIVHGDARTVDLHALGLSDHTFKVVANIPYYLTGMLLRLFLAGDVQPSRLVFLMQREVAKRVTASLARGEKESLLSLSVKVFGIPVYVRTVGKGHFDPPPKVDSGILLVQDISRDRLDGINAEAFFALLHYGFGQKRKQLLGNLALRLDRATVVHALSTRGLREDIRAEDIPIEDWLALTALLMSPTRPQ